MTIKNRVFKLLIILTSILLSVSYLNCGNTKFSANNQDIYISSYLYTQYAFLLEQSFEYDQEHEDFRKEINNVVDTITRYVDVMDKRINPFKMDSPRSFKSS